MKTVIVRVRVYQSRVDAEDDIILAMLALRHGFVGEDRHTTASRDISRSTPENDQTHHSAHKSMLR